VVSARSSLLLDAEGPGDRQGFSALGCSVQALAAGGIGHRVLHDTLVENGFDERAEWRPSARRWKASPLS
jgi:hypothetical protein